MLEVSPWVNSTASRIVYAVEVEDHAVRVEDDFRFDLAQLGGGLTRTLLTGGGRFDGLSADEGRILYRRRDSGIIAYDIAAGKEDVLITGDERSQLYQSKFWPNDHWVLFMKRERETPSLSRLFVAPIDGETPVPERALGFQVSVGESLFDKCRSGWERSPNLLRQR